MRVRLVRSCGTKVFKPVFGFINLMGLNSDVTFMQGNLIVYCLECPQLVGIGADWISISGFEGRGWQKYKKFNWAFRGGACKKRRMK